MFQLKSIFKKKKAFAFLFLLFFSLSSLFSQTLNINHYGIEEGLPQSGINAIAKDNQGNIWVGTMSGVSKYNGLKFENFSKKDGLAENRVTCIYVDRSGLIWIGHWAGSITIYNPVAKEFSEFVVKDNELTKPVTVIYQDELMNFWFGTKGEGLMRYVPLASEHKNKRYNGEGKPYRYLYTEELSKVITSIVPYQKNALLIGTGKGLLLVKNHDTEPDIAKFVSRNELEDLYITAVLPDENNIWIGSQGKGLYKCNARDLKIVRNYLVKDGVPDLNISVLFKDADNSLFVGTTGGGLCKYLPQLERDNYKGPWFQTINTNQGLSNDKVNGIIQDREKNIWIGTAIDLNQYFDERFEIYGQYEGLTHSIVWSVIQSKDGSFWLGTDGGLVHFIKGINSNINQFIQINDPNSKVPIKNTSALYEDNLGRIWYSNFGNGVTVYNPKTKAFINYNTSNGLTSNEVYDIEGDRDGNIWIATNKGGACQYLAKEDRFVNYNVTNGLGGNNVYAIYRDSRNRIWFGILGGALTKLEEGKFTRFYEKDGYHNKFTLCVAEDFKGDIWFGTYEGGMYKYDGSEFTHYSMKDGASSDMPYLMINDNKANLWIGTPVGIDKFNLHDNSFKHYGKNDGFLGVEINPNAVCKDKDGNLWFGSIIGLVKYNSKKEKNNEVEPLTQIRPPRVFFKDFKFPDDHVLSHNDNHITFDFFGASLTNPKRVKYRYFLQGYESDWSPPTAQNFVTYPNLPPGKYTFWLKASNNDGVWNKKPQSFEFEIRPPFWKTKAFFIISMIIIILGIVVFVKVRERSLIQRNIKLEAQVAERTVELKKEKEHVQKQNVEIQTQKVELEKKNINITDSIDYAKRIQESIFVPEFVIHSIFREAFMMFKPKDIVSGDFYWINIADDKIIFALADCTGHGVPGAFMSLIGYNLLNEIVKDQGVTDPAEILTKLKLQIHETLHKGKDGVRIQDGMDMVVCVLNEGYTQLEYAGAFMPLYLVQKGEFKELKPNRISIGRRQVFSEDRFVTQKVTVNRGDMIYLCSDGFSDQIGGAERKKFYSHRFKDLLLSISDKPATEQSRLLEQTLVAWQENNEQIDDITVWGIRV